MSGPQFFQTGMGKIFFEGTMPRLYRAIDRLADVLAGPREYKVVTIKSNDALLQGELDDLGASGWRMTHVESGRMFFERPAPRKEKG